MTEDILGRVKVIHEKCASRDESVDEVYQGYLAVDLLPELIAEVEAKRQLALGMLTKNKELADRAIKAEAEVERLRSLNESLMENGNDLRTRCQKAEARIKGLESEITAWIADRDSWIARYEAVREEKDARIADQEAYIKRLEAAFLEQFVQGIQAPREMAELMARGALERIKEGKG